MEAKTEEILQQITIKDPTTKIYPELAKQSKKGGDTQESTNMENKIFDIKEEDAADLKDKKRASKKKAGEGFCARCCRKRAKTN